MPTCGGIEDRRAEQRPEDAAVGDRERAALEVGERQRAILGALGELADALLDLGERQPVGVAQHGHDQPLGGADGDADVEVVLEHHLVALDLGVDAREAAQRADRRLDEERRDPEADAVAVLEGLLVTLAQRHHGGHVHLVEGGEHRGGALRLDQPPGDRGAALRHAHAFLGAVALRMPAILGDRRHGLRLRRRRRCCRCCRRCRAGGRRLLDITPHHAAAVAASAHAGEIDGVGLGGLLRRRGRARRARVVVLLRRLGRPGSGGWCFRRRRGAADADSSRIPRTSPTFTSSPSWRSMRLSTPACGALTSTSILSVSSSTSGSPAATASPSLRSHLRDARVHDGLTDFGHEDI